MGSPTVHVVDDDASVRRALGRLLRAEGLRVELYESPAVLLERAASPADCLLLDIDLPGMDGLELHRRLLAGGEAPPVIFITGVPNERSRAQALEQEAVAYLEKPIEVDLLLTTIRLALST